LRNVATSHPDPIIDAALDTLESSSTPDVGVEPLSDLASWFFTSVSPKVESVSLVPDQGAGLLSHIASAVLSKLRFKPRGLPEGNDVLSVLARAEYHLNEKDLDTAARELNQLSGWSKALLKDWLDAARARLEVQQALEDASHGQSTVLLWWIAALGYALKTSVRLTMNGSSYLVTLAKAGGE
ncbi:hypothetical protein M407DRAFT_12989, partial [Tulasnella calospora MUT 4182]